MCRSAAWGCTDCKGRMADVLVTFLEEPRETRAALEGDPDRLRRILADGADRARAVARATLDEVKGLTGLGGW